MKHKRKELCLALIFVLLAALVLTLCGRALRPVRQDYGAQWGPFLAEEKNSLDYLYLGSSYAYCDVNPGLIYAESGLTGQVLAGPEQTLSTTYYYLKEALRRQAPALVILEGSALQFERYQAYSQINVGYMPFSASKLAAIFRAAEPELRTGLFFELYFYHGRWKDLTAQELKKNLTPAQTDDLRGFTPVEGVFEQIAQGPFPRAQVGAETYAENLVWLQKIGALCKERGIPFALSLHPTYSRFDATCRADMAQELAALGLPFYDWSEETARMDLVPTEHFFDPGHLNQQGAAYFSRWLADWLVEEQGLSPRAQSAENAAAWQQTARASLAAETAAVAAP